MSKSQGSLLAPPAWIVCAAVDEVGKKFGRSTCGIDLFFKRPSHWIDLETEYSPGSSTHQTGSGRACLVRRGPRRVLDRRPKALNQPSEMDV